MIRKCHNWDNPDPKDSSKKLCQVILAMPGCTLPCGKPRLGITLPSAKPTAKAKGSRDTKSPTRPRPTSAVSAQSTDSASGSGDEWQIVADTGQASDAVSDSQQSDLSFRTSQSCQLNLRPEEILDQLLAQQRIDSALAGNLTSEASTEDILLISDRMTQMKAVFDNLHAQLQVQPENMEVKAKMTKLDGDYTQLQKLLASLKATQQQRMLSDDAMSGSTQQ